jgi:hypothetical protein
MGAKRKLDNDWHLIPSGDMKPHRPSVRCWCKPEPEDDSPSQGESSMTWLHNSMDQRELFELGIKDVH